MIRDELIEVIETNRRWVKRMSDGYLSTGSNSSEEIADALLSVFSIERPDNLKETE